MVVNTGIRKVLERLPPRCAHVSVEEALAELARLEGRRWAVLDFETASFSEPRVVEVGLVGMDGDVLMEELVNPQIPMTKQVIEIHGLTDADVAGADAWPVVQARLGRVLQDHGVEVVVAFNASFEAMCLAYNAEVYGVAGLDVELVCLQRVALGLLGPAESGWLSLRRACEQVGVEEVPTHRAVADCVATVGLALQFLINRGAVVLPPATPLSPIAGLTGSPLTVHSDQRSTTVCGCTDGVFANRRPRRSSSAEYQGKWRAEPGEEPSS